MSLGILALIFSALGAGWLLWRLSRSEGIGADERNITLLKSVVLLAIVAVLAVAKLGPLAFMVLVAAGGVMAIETWRSRLIDDDIKLNERVDPARKTSMTVAEAIAVLGVDDEADIETIRSAHRKLISQIHPDKGGTDYLASKINEARDVLAERLND